MRGDYNMLKILKERTPEVIIERHINFVYKADPNAGFIFPAKANGEPDFNKMCPEAIENYRNCLMDGRFIEPEFVVDKRTYMNPAVGKCVCGAEVILDSDYYGAVRCDCGRWYNLFGQSLKDPKYWEEDYEY
jgi:hypothetical protein